MLTVEQATKNIAKYARRVNKTQWKKGTAWYKEANTFCATLAKHEQFPVESVVGCLAALSPQCAWNDNLLATISLVKTRRVPATLSVYPANVSKAFSIVHENVHPDKILGGLKVRAFHQNILHPSTSRAVTVDTHAARAAFDAYALNPKQVSFTFNKKGNAVIQQAYKDVARRYKILPLKLQAAVWLRVKADLQRKPEVEQLGLYIK